jgi:2-C-methyl-D-erythritol 2,4-cyclodiphosphate synthase
MSDVRVGLGFDVHPRSADPERPLFLAGVRFVDEPGLAGHSDADVVCHAVADALLGAAGLGDLGEHFPDTDPRHAGIGGLELLARVAGMLADRGLVTGSCDATLVAERPHVAPHRAEMRSNIGLALGIGEDRVSVKATRPEGLGLSGDGAGCLAVALVVRRDDAGGAEAGIG